MVEKYKIYKNETRDRINNIFEACDNKAGSQGSPCTWPCKECRLSNEYEEIAGVRIEDVDAE